MRLIVMIFNESQNFNKANLIKNLYVVILVCRTRFVSQLQHL